MAADKAGQLQGLQLEAVRVGVGADPLPSASLDTQSGGLLTMLSDVDGIY